jgi:hypothetical protein
MHKKKWSAEVALKYVKGKRDIVNPNVGFLQQLIKYEEQILGKENQEEILGKENQEEEKVEEHNRDV